MGASDGMGTFAVQIVKEFGAQVTGVCSTTKMDLVRSIGAHHLTLATRARTSPRGQRPLRHLVGPLCPTVDTQVAPIHI
jgi:NADPH:quinone reductase-like Zn-dependent oxidoreductase